MVRRYYTQLEHDDPMDFYTNEGADAQYRLLQKRLNRMQDSVLYRSLKIAPLPDAFFAEPERYEDLAEKAGDNDTLKFCCYTKLARDAFRGNDFQRTVRFYHKALTLQPRDMVVNTRLAAAFERLGDAEHAIEYYESAAKEAFNEELKTFFQAQITRIKSKGPAEWRPQPIY